MELKPGYKQTEVGVIPDEWDVKTISDIANVKTGPFGSALHESDYVQDGTPIITVEHLSDYGVVHENLPLVSDSDRARLRNYSLRENDIVFSRVGSVDRNSLIRKTEDGWLFSGRLLRVRVSDSSLCPPYLSYHFHSEPFKQRVREVAVGQTMASLNTQILKAIDIVIPSSPEQRAIANALSDADALLDGLDRLIAKKRDMKQAAMQQLLTGETRLPGFTGEWEEKRLGELGIFLKGSGVKKDDSQGGAIPCVRYGELYTNHNEYIKNYYSFISPEVASTAQALKRGDILFAGSGETREEIGKCAAFVDDCEAYAGGDIVIFRSQGLDPLFLGFSLNMPSVNRQKASKGQGDAVVHISAAALSSIVVTLPPEIDEQTAIATVLADMDAEIAALEQRRAKTKDLKQAMMQELLTGRIRLIKPCESVAQEVSKSTDAKPHSWAFNEAVVISTLAKHFGKEDFPLGRKRYTKLSYLLHRHAERQAEGYLKKAAGPYNPKTKYGGPERIALENGYIREHKNGRYSGFVASDNVAQAEDYFAKWYGPDAVQWLNQFRFKTNDDLEVLATVDMAAEELRASGKVVDVTSVKEVIRSHPEWEAKLDRTAFSDTNIANGIKQSHILFNSDNAGGPDA